jgi:hypothetical protein
MLVSLILALLLLLLAYRRLKRIRIPPRADFFTTLRHVPLVLVIILDLLDFALDFMAIPIGWALLRHLGLGNLIGVTVVEELIPGTQFIPTLTISWLLARAGVRLPSRSLKDYADHVSPKRDRPPR